MGDKFNPDKTWERTSDYKSFQKSKDVDQGFYDSDQYKNFSYTGTDSFMRTMQFTRSKYGFGQGSGGYSQRVINAMDNAYEQYLKSNIDKSKSVQTTTKPNSINIDITKEPVQRRRGKKLMIASPMQGFGTSGGLL